MGGAIPVGDLVEIITRAGFEEVEFAGYTSASTSRFTQGGLFVARKGNG